MVFDDLLGREAEPLRDGDVVVDVGFEHLCEVCQLQSVPKRRGYADERLTKVYKVLGSSVFQVVCVWYRHVSNIACLEVEGTTGRRGHEDGQAPLSL